MTFARLLAAAAALLLAAPALAQTAPAFRPGAAITQNNPQPVRVRCWTGTEWGDCSMSGGTGGGGGDASASNQTTQITAANLTNARLGDVTSPAAGSINARLATATTSLASIDTKLPAKDGNGDLRVPTVSVTAIYVYLSANTSTEILAASATTIGVELQCVGTADVGLSMVHATLTKAVPDNGGSGNVDTVLPAGSKPMYVASYVSGSGITAYTTTAQACWGKRYARQ